MIVRYGPGSHGCGCDGTVPFTEQLAHRVVDLVAAIGNAAGWAKDEAALTLTPVAICVPVRNEEAELPRHLAALAALRTDGLAVTVCFFLDACHDGSERLIRTATPTFPCPVIASTGGGGEPNAGAARRAAMAAGLARLGDGGGAILLTTDADSAPEPGWLQAAVAVLVTADVAAGRVVRADAGGDPGQDRLERYLDRLHRYRRAVDPVPWDDPDGCHYTSGANLAVHATVYRAIGGFRRIAAGEDATFADDAARAGFRVARAPAMIVRTSSRRAGRAAGGLATMLRERDRGAVPMVAHPAGAAWQYRAHALARRCFADIGGGNRRAELERLLALDGDHLLGVARDCPNAEAFAMRVVPAPPEGDRTIPLADAEAALVALEWSERAAVA